MAQLGAKARVAALDVAVDDHAAADTGAQRHHHQVVRGRVGDQLRLGQGGAVRVVVHEHGHAEAIAQLLAQGDPLQRDVHAGQRGARGELHLRRHTHPDRLGPGAVTRDFVDRALDAFEQRVGVREVGGLLDLARRLGPFHARDGHLGAADIDSEH